MGTQLDLPRPAPFMPPTAPNPGIASPAGTSTKLRIRQAANQAKQKGQEQQLAMQRMLAADVAPQPTQPTTAAPMTSRACDNLVHNRQLLDRFVDMLLFG